MTILMTADSSGGVWTFAIDLARGLAARGVGIVLAVMGRPLSVEQRRAADQIPGLTLTARPYRVEWMEESLDEVEEAGAWLLDLARATAPDVVHINGFVHAALPFQAPVLVTAHSSVVSQFHAVKRAAASSDWLRYEQAVKRGLAGARLVVAPSRAMAMSIIQHYAPHTPVVPIHNGRHPAGFAAGTKEPFVLTAGRVAEEGSAEAMADAYFRVYGRLASTPWVSPSRKLACARDARDASILQLGPAARTTTNW